MALCRTRITCVVTALMMLGPIAAAGRSWREARYAHYSIFYEPGFERDADFMAKWADRAERLMRVKYGVAPLHYRISIYLHANPAPGVDENNARIRCCTGGDSYSTGSIDLLAPSAPAMRDAHAISSLGMPKNDESYQAKILMSEYIPIGHYEVQRGRPQGGWNYYDAPEWFVQGLQEYDGIFHTTRKNRTTTAKRLLSWAAAHRNGFSCCNPDLTITDAYNGGATFMAFLASEFGEGVHVRLLRDSASTFTEALSAVTQPYSRAQLFDRFNRWLDERARTVHGN